MNQLSTSPFCIVVHITVPLGNPCAESPTLTSWYFIHLAKISGLSWQFGSLDLAAWQQPLTTGLQCNSHAVSLLPGAGGGGGRGELCCC